MIWDIVNEDWEQIGLLTTLFSGKCTSSCLTQKAVHIE